MAEFSVNAGRRDPYKAFKFRVRWDNRVVAGVSHISGLKRTTEVVVHRSGGDQSVARRSPGRTSFAPIVLERGVTHDPAFEQWANLVQNFGANGEIALRGFRKDVVVELLNEAGQLAIAYKVFRCWPSSYEALADLDAAAGATAIQRLVLENEGWERDVEVAEPQER